MEISFIEGSPALLVKRERLLVAGDLHVGRSLGLQRSGIQVPNATERLSGSLLKLCKKYKAKGIVLLGDVKDSVGYPTKEEYQELSSFFYQLRNVDVTITKGNHDSRIEEIVKRLDANVRVEKELVLDRVVLMHGHALPSEEAMMKSRIVTAHSHPAVNINGRLEKAWAVVGLGKGVGKFYEKYNKRIKLVMMPAFNDLITGTELSTGSKFAPLLRNEIFDIKKAKAYDLMKKALPKDTIRDLA